MQLFGKVSTKEAAFVSLKVAPQIDKALLEKYWAQYFKKIIVAAQNTINDIRRKRVERRRTGTLYEKLLSQELYRYFTKGRQKVKSFSIRDDIYSKKIDLYLSKFDSSSTIKKKKKHG